MNDRERPSRSVAVERLLDLRASPDDTATERIELPDAAGRILGEPADAPADVPQCDRATMDGFAFAASDEYPLTIVGESLPEDDPTTIEPGEAVEIATGAPLPPTADTVLMREKATVEGGRLSGPVPTPGANVYPAGATAAAGERLFAAGERLAPRHIALLRDVGIGAVTVQRPLDIGILATGTEIHEGRQLDRDSEMLRALFGRWGHGSTIVGSVPDERAAVREAITTAAANYDVVVTTGGTGAGSADHVVSVLGGHDILFRGVDLRPGRPVTVATVDETPVCALPGKPIAAHAAATLVVRPFLTGRARLPRVTADLTARVTVPEGDTEFAIPVRLDGRRATPLGHVDSSLQLYEERFAPGRVASSTRVALADGVVLTRDTVGADEQVAVIPYEVIE